MLVDIDELQNPRDPRDQTRRSLLWAGSLFGVLLVFFAVFYLRPVPKEVPLMLKAMDAAASDMSTRNLLRFYAPSYERVTQGGKVIPVSPEEVAQEWNRTFAQMRKNNLVRYRRSEVLRASWVGWKRLDTSVERFQRTTDILGQSTEQTDRFRYSWQKFDDDWKIVRIQHLPQPIRD